MKKTFITVLVVLLAVSAVFTGCKKKEAAGQGSTLTVGVNPVPHGELINLVKDDLAKEGITLKIVEYTDYIQPNEALIAGDLDANYFQHIPYLESNDAWKAALSFVYGVHVEPLGLYSSKVKNVADLPNKAKIFISTDPANAGRGLILLQNNGLITLKPNVGLRGTPQDIISNPKNFQFTALDPAQIPRSLADADAAIINGNYALEAGLNPAKDSILLEGGESPYANGIAVKKGNENDSRILILQKALQSQKIKDYIDKKWDGSVVAAF
jgi:D-methionine transport system substrate-binding protein